MKLFPVVAVLGAVTSALSQAVVIGAPTSGTTLSLGQTFTAQLLVFPSFAACIDVNIILAIANCNNGVCPQKNDAPGNVLYAGPFLATEHPDGLYQNFSMQVPQYMSAGPAAFSLRRRCLLQGTTLQLEFSDVSLTIKK
ncbi:hypothetical protein HD554DRAFT_2038237 [Boletus coccyginus]|nr:hypothetical protein HD554DRAFT_2038237 [Boletus coccyginus]